MRAALYLRVATPHGNKPDGHDQMPENQSLRLREFATTVGWTITAEFADVESGAKADCTQFQALMASASKREFDVVLVWSLDRFSGEGLCKTLQHINTLGGYGVDFRSFSEPFIDTTCEFGHLVRSILGFFAAFERKHLSERIRAGHDRIRAQGKHIGRPRTAPPIKHLAKVRRLPTDRHSSRQIVDLDLGHGTVQPLASATQARKKRRNVLETAIDKAKAIDEPTSAARSISSVRTSADRF
jgi:DNA invertase Pin-like site-specific DNA recombinase